MHNDNEKIIFCHRHLNAKTGNNILSTAMLRGQCTKCTHFIPGFSIISEIRHFTVFIWQVLNYKNCFEGNGTHCNHPRGGDIHAREIFFVNSSK